MNLKKYKTSCPPYLKDQCLLFIARLEKILRLPPSIQPEFINDVHLRKVFALESKWHRFVLEKMSTYLSFPVIDIFDVAYPYARSYVDRV